MPEVPFPGSLTQIILNLIKINMYVGLQRVYLTMKHLSQSMM